MLNIQFPFLLVNKAILRIIVFEIVFLFLPFLLSYPKESFTLNKRIMYSSDVFDGPGKGSKTNWQQ